MPDRVLGWVPDHLQLPEPFPVQVPARVSVADPVSDVFMLLRSNRKAASIAAISLIQVLVPEKIR